MNEKQIEKKALVALSDRVDKVHDKYTSIVGDTACVDVHGTTGGDEVHYRVYFKGNEIDFITCK